MSFCDAVVAGVEAVESGLWDPVVSASSGVCVVSVDTLQVTAVESLSFTFNTESLPCGRVLERV